MTTENGIEIRRYQAKDREAVRKICYQTSFLERPELFAIDEEIVADTLSLYPTDFESQSCCVAVLKGEVVGYIMGISDQIKMRKIFNRYIFPVLVGKALKKGIFLRGSFWQLAWQAFLSFLKGEFWAPDFHREYPAMFHINLHKNFRCQGIGSHLVNSLEKIFQERKIKGIHLGTMSEEAKNFFVKNSYQVLYQSRRSCLEYCLKQKVPCYILGKNL